MAPKAVFSVSIDKNSLINFWREGRELSLNAFSAQCELFQKYFKISLSLRSEEGETSLFEETLKNIELKTQNIVEVEEPATKKEKKKKIKAEPRDETRKKITETLKIEDFVVHPTQSDGQDEDAPEGEHENAPDGEHEDYPDREHEDAPDGEHEDSPCLSSSCNREACKRYSIKLEAPEPSQCDIALKKEEEFTDNCHGSIKREDITECSECNFKAASFWTLKIHMEMLHLEMRWRCAVCDYNTKEKYIIRRHIKNEHQVYTPEQMRFQCGRCQESGPMASYLSHIRDHHAAMAIFYQERERTEKAPFKCKFCSQMFENITIYRTHLEMVHMSLQYTCSLCGFMVTSKLSIRKHVSSVHCQGNRETREVKRFVRDNITRECTFCCNSPLKYKENLEEHILNNHPDKFSKKVRRPVTDPSKLQQCNFCDFGSDSKVSIRTHVMSKHIKAMFECRNCTLRVKTLSVLKKHIKSEHEADDSGLIRSSCGSCSFSTMDLGDFRLHLKNKHFPFIKNDPNKPLKRKSNKGKKKKKETKIYHDKLPTYLCKDCNIRTLVKGEIIEHVIENHDIADEEENDEQFEEFLKKIEVKCISCSFSGTLSEYGCHMSASSKELQACTLCGSHCRDDTDLADHLLTNHRGCRYSCTTCDYTHPDRRKVLLHSKREHGKRSFSYSCGLCDLKASQALMVDHCEKTHSIKTEVKTEEQLGQCDYCDYKHINQSKLEEHNKRFHKVYACKHCEETFYKRKKLDIHIMKNHQDFTFDCDKCEFKTKHESALYRHTSSIHMKVEPFPCHDCGKHFNRKDNLAVHVRKVHTK